MSDPYGDEKACRPLRDSGFRGDAYPALKRWATLFRPTEWDWIVMGSGSIDVASRGSPCDGGKGGASGRTPSVLR
jgi:hypothetical protein